MRTILVIIIILFSGYIYATPDKIQVTDLDGRVFEGDGIRFETNNQVTLLSKGATPTSFAGNNLAGISVHGNTITPSIQAGAGFRITLVNQDILYGAISDTAKNGFTIYNNIIGKIPLNFEQISAIERVEDKESLSLKIMDAVRKTEREDTVFLLSGDMDSGIVISLTPDKVSIRSTLYNQDRTYKISDVRAINLFSFPATPEKTPKDNPDAIVYLSDNSRLSGLISQIKPLNPPLMGPIPFPIILAQNKSSYQIPIQGVSFICFRNSRCTYLSDLEPADAKEYISPDDKIASSPANRDKSGAFLWHYQKDRGLFSQKPISLQGRKYSKGLAAHANCELTYKLDGSYQKFFATIGLASESAKGENDELSGSVRFIIYADGKKAYESEVFEKDSPPKDISIDIKSAKELRLVVSDAGDGYIFDRAAWALARVVR